MDFEFTNYSHVVAEFIPFSHFDCERADTLGKTRIFFWSVVEVSRHSDEELVSPGDDWDFDAMRGVIGDATSWVEATGIHPTPLASAIEVAVRRAVCMTLWLERS